MSAILVHIGCTGPYIDSTQPPAHMFDCIEQYKLFNDSDLFILTNKENLKYFASHHLFTDNVSVFAIEDFHSPKISEFERLYNFGPREFWTVTFTRLMYIENFMRMQGLCHVCEFANDVLVYFNISDYASTFHDLYPGLAITPCGPQHVLDGFMYIHTWEALAHMTDFFVDRLRTLGIGGIIRERKYDMVNEMTMMHYYVEKHRDRVGFLPIMPFGEYSTGVDRFNAVFDPATWGQYVGGSRTDSPGMKPQNHYIGVMLNDNPSYDVVWGVHIDTGTLYVPFFSYDGKLVKINNLHIHSKNTKLYMSNRSE